jgi:hypothetical protein
MDPSRSDKKNRTGRVNGLYISSGPDQMFDCERRSHRVSGQVKDNIFSKLLGIGLNALNTFRGTLI